MQGELSSRDTIQGSLSPQGGMNGTLSPTGSISGELTDKRVLSARLQAAARLNGALSLPETLYVANYDYLTHKPSINGVVIQGDGLAGDYHLLSVYSKTTAEWAENREISEKGAIYIYTDYEQDSQGDDVPAFKLGDGKAYIVDLPFTDILMQEHMANTNIHITPEERAFWNSKNRALALGENLILTEL